MIRLGRPFVALLAVVAIAVPISIAISFMDPTSLAMAALLAVMLGSTALILLRYRPDGDALTLLVFLATYYMLAFGLGPAYIWITRGAGTSTRLDVESMIPAMAVATLGWLGLVAGFLVNPLRALGRTRLPIRVLPSATPVLVRCVPLFIVGWAGRAVTIAQGTYFHTLPAGGEVVSSASNWTVTVVATLPTLATAVIGAYAFARPGRTSGPLKALFLVLLGVEIAWQVPVGSRGALINLLVIAGVIAYYGRQRVPRKLLVSSTVVLVFIVFPMYLQYRGNGDLYQSNPAGSMSAAIAGTFSKNPVDFIGAGAAATVSRFSDIESASRILQQPDQLLPHAHGETLTWIAYAGLPRFVALDKPDPGLFGNEVGRVSGMISATDYVTSINFGQPFELYLALGWVGLGVGMAAIGAIYRLISDLTEPRKHNPLVLALYATSVMELTMSSGVIVALGLVGEIKVMLVYGVVLLFVSGGIARVPVGSKFGAWTPDPSVHPEVTGSHPPAAPGGIG